MTKLSWHNAYGQIQTAPIMSEFHDEDGRVFYVVGPVTRSAYDTSPPYLVIGKGEGGWRHD